MPADRMDELGASAFSEMKKELKKSKDKKVIAEVNCVTRRIVKALHPEAQFHDWEVIVFENETPNAFALPGKKIGVHTGMLKVAKNPDQLAAVIGHEIGHVLAQHGNERVSQGVMTQLGLVTSDIILSNTKMSPAARQATIAALGLGAQVGILLPYSRDHESEADLIGLKLMAKAGFKPDESLELWRNMEKFSKGGTPPEFLSTHPANQTRIKNLERHLPEALEIYKEAAVEATFGDC